MSKVTGRLLAARAWGGSESHCSTGDSCSSTDLIVCKREPGSIKYADMLAGGPHMSDADAVYVLEIPVALKGRLSGDLPY